MSTVDRLKIVIEAFNMNPHEFAKLINVSKDSIYQVLKGREMTPFLRRKLFDACPELNEEWFNRGEGEMFKWKREPIIKETKSSESPEVLMLRIKEMEFIIGHYLKIIQNQSEIIAQLSKINVDNKKEEGI